MLKGLLPYTQVEQKIGNCQKKSWFSIRHKVASLSLAGYNVGCEVRNMTSFVALRFWPHVVPDLFESNVRLWLAGGGVTMTCNKIDL